NAAAWEFPGVAGEKREVAAYERTRWTIHLATLDTALLSMLGEAQIEDADIAATLDEALASSLWSRRLSRRTSKVQNALTSGLLARARYVWANSTPIKRKAYFLAGVGLQTGHALDTIATR